MPKVEELPIDHPLSKDNAILDTKKRLERELRILERTEQIKNDKWQETRRKKDIERLREQISKLDISPIPTQELHNPERLAKVIDKTPKALEKAKAQRKIESAKLQTKETGFKKFWSWITGNKKSTQEFQASQKRVRELEDDQSRLAYKLGKATRKEQTDFVFEAEEISKQPLREIDFEEDHKTQELETLK